jgi:signal transduction histidine kinase/ActR/RegA family two-component response regulator
MVPVLALTASLAYLLVEHEKETFRRGAMDRNRTFMTAIDSELHGHVRSLEALAAAPSLARGDLGAFHDAARRVMRSQPDWRNVLLFRPDATQLVNLRMPYGGTLPPTIEVDTVRRAVATRKPAIGDVSRGPLGDADFALPIRLPVQRDDGEVVYVLSAIIKLDRFARIMAAQRYPDGWAIALVDSAGVFIARIPARPAGQRASADFWAAIQRAKEGWFRGRTLEGTDTFTAHLTSEVTGWTVGVAVPSAQVYATAHRAAWTIAIGGIAGLALAIAFAYWMSRRIAAPITRLAAGGHAPDGAQGEVSPGRGGIDEVRELAAALRDRESLREREKIALQAADKAKDEFLAMLGHELRNPLSAITTAAQLLRLARSGDPDAAHAHGVLERQTRQMTRLIQDLLDVSRLAMGKVTLQREVLELGEFTERAARTWQQARRRADMALHIRTAPVWVNADRGRMEQVICNLLDNADKFSPAGSAIEVRVFPDHGHAVLEVQDRGEGIPAEMLERIFELFVQGPQSSDRARGGMGLGLTLVKRLVELHEGSVQAFSDGPGTGARFVARLPAAAAAGDAAEGTHRREELAESRRVLVVEDNEDGRAMLEALLRHEGHAVRVAPNGALAVDIMSAEWPEVAIVDIGLPDIDGYEVARRVRALGRPISLIALTGYGQETDQRRAYEAGFDLHLTKPVEAHVLREALAVLTAKRRALDTSL